MREKILAGNIYHVFNRGTDKRTIFMEDGDYIRFIHDLFEFNDTNPINNNHYSFKNNVIGSRYIVKKSPRQFLVEILAFALMPNHYHLLLRPRFDDGITKFMKRLNMGYSRYFNEKYERSGTLFQGRYKMVGVQKESHLIHLPYYIHLNPLDLFAPEWRDRKLNNLTKVMKFLDQYRWSSLLDYMGKKNFPSVTQRDFLNSFYGGAEKYKEAFMDWLKNLDLASIGDVMIE